ncbi:protein phosphatase 2C domain-containing protein [Streptomyces sp. NPDC088354]|uniref:protein phosphatase 2C domain-containing protein n=1 Tax=Streptomyces sp. NPDC088354 TaxID=3365856 RepID=UPI0037F1D047
MSQQGETGRRQEDEWWRQLYGRTDPGAGGAGEQDDTLDDRYTSAVSALGGEPHLDPGPPGTGADRPDGDRTEPEPGPPDTLRLRRQEPPPAGDVPRPWQYQSPPEPSAAEPPGLPPGWVPAEPSTGETGETGQTGQTGRTAATAPVTPDARVPQARTAPGVRIPGPSGPPGDGGSATSAVTVPDTAFLGDGPPTYAPEPTAWPLADPGALDDLVPDTVLDGARYGVLTVRTAVTRGDSARYRGEPRRDALLTARFGAGDDALLLFAVATGPRVSAVAHRAARDACHGIASAVGRSHARLAEDIRGSRRGSLKSGLQRLTDRCCGRLRAKGEELGLDPGEYDAGLRCLLLPVDPDCRIRLFFGVGDGGLFRIRGGEWQDLEPLRSGEPAEPEDGPAVDFRFRASIARPGDTLLLCSSGLADPLRGEPALAAHLAERWGAAEPPGLPAFLGDARTRVKGYADDRTVVAVWDA